MSANPIIHGKEVDKESLGVENVNKEDYPNFVDAFFSSGRFTNGVEMTEAELELLTEEASELLNEVAHASFIGNLF